MLRTPSAAVVIIMKRMTYLLLLSTLLGACASQVPRPNREAPHGPTLEMERGHVQQYIGTDERWGGSIVKVENRPAETVLEIVARPLQDYGRPAEEGESSGRFLARYSCFLDPMIFS